ncbi:YggT family protein [Bacillaceae bacterium SIJ1]|uniref:YggT family protein n=1 Tax=Litoribacterium kuwaitense TaxID=1398745 RepID=UPI0013EA248B|nr:YggT family protein [Litoribacterium kuwaitense]NGP44327.1 YggT family protein [Litoribacterium kuwaitense]
MSQLFVVLANVLQLYMYVIIVYVLMSWFPNARESSFGQLIGRLVRPYMEPFQRIIPPLGMIDISPIVAIITLQLAISGAYQLARMFI